jgi:dTMP kinase
VAEPVYANAAAGGPEASSVGTLTRLFGSRWYFRLWVSQVVSSLGDWIGLIAVTAIAARVGGGNSGAAVGLVLSARVVPGLFLGSFMGVLADRLDRKRTMVCCDAGRALVLLTLPFVKDIPTLFFASLLLELFTLLWSSAKEASVPNLVDRKFLPTANSLSLAAAYGTFPISSAVFAGLVQLAQSFGKTFGVHSLGPESLALWFDTVTFLVSATTIATLALPRRDHVAGEPRRVDFGRVWGDLKEGFRFIRANPVVRAVLIGLACGLGGGGTVVPLGPVFSKVVLHSGSSGFGVLLTAFGVGVAMGVLGVSVIQKRLTHMRVFLFSAFAGGVFLIASASMAQLMLASLWIAGFGLCTGTVYVLGFSMLQTEVSDEFRGRVFATLYTSTRLCLFLALVVAPLMSTLLDDLSRSLLSRQLEVGGFTVYLPGVRLTLWLGGAIVIVAAFLARRTLRSVGYGARVDPSGGAPGGTAEGPAV